MGTFKVKCHFSTVPVSLYKFCTDFVPNQYIPSRSNFITILYDLLYRKGQCNKGVLKVKQVGLPG